MEEEMTVEDFNLLEKYTLARVANVVAEQVDAWQIPHEEERLNKLMFD